MVCFSLFFFQVNNRSTHLESFFLFPSYCLLNGQANLIFVPQRFDDNAEQAGLTAADEEIADWLRKNYSNKFVILAVNKCESPRKGMMQASEFWSFG